MTVTIDGTLGITTPAATVSGALSASGASSTAGFASGTGSGGAVTQITSRTTGVTLNTPTGAITLFTAAGSATPAAFTVTNSTVGANDVIILNVKSGATNTYALHVGAVSAGSFVVNFWAQTGTASDTPVIQYTVIKGAIS